MTLKIAVLAAIPSAIATVTEIVTTGARRVMRHPYRRSVITLRTMDVLLAGAVAACDCNRVETSVATRRRRSGGVDSQTWRQYQRRAAGAPAVVAMSSNSSARSAARKARSSTAGRMRTIARASRGGAGDRVLLTVHPAIPARARPSSAPASAWNAAARAHLVQSG